MQKSAKFWNAIAEKYAKSPIADMKSYTYTLDCTRSYLKPDDAVLELGCGTGSTALLLAPHVRRIVASDIAENMIEIAKKKAQDQGIANVEFVTAELFEVGAGPERYDAVLALNLLHLLEDVPAAITRIHGLVKPGGLFISKTICRFGPEVPLKLRLMKLVLPLMQMIGKAPFVQFMDIAELERIITMGGFEIVEAGNFPPSPPMRYIVARKV